MRDGKISKKWIAKLHSDDVKAFGLVHQGKNTNPNAATRHRNGHRLYGNAAVESMITGKKVYLIMPRWNKKDLAILNKDKGISGKKEWKNIQSNKNLSVLTLDDINFGKDKKLKEDFKRIRQVGIDLDAKLEDPEKSQLEKCMVKLKEGLYSGTYKIKK